MVDRKDITDLAILLESKDVIDSLISAFIEKKDEEYLTPSDIHSSTTDTVSTEISSNILGFLGDLGLADYEPIGTEKRYSIKYDETIDLLSEVRKRIDIFEDLDEDKNPNSYDLVCSIPQTDPELADKAPVDFNMDSITGKLLNLFGESTEQITIVNPFFEEKGVEWLSKGLKKASRNGADIEIITREIEDKKSNKIALEDIINDIRASGSSKVELFDYHKESEDEDHPEFTTHAKVIIFDYEKAYIGSANLTSYSFDSRFEIGVIVKGDKIEDLINLCATHRDTGSTTKIELDSLR